MRALDRRLQAIEHWRQSTLEKRQLKESIADVQRILAELEEEEKNMDPEQRRIKDMEMEALYRELEEKFSY